VCYSPIAPLPISHTGLVHDQPASSQNDIQQPITHIETVTEDTVSE